MITPGTTCGRCVHLTACERTFGRVVPRHPEWTTAETIREDSTFCRYEPPRWADASDIMNWHQGRMSP
jgi:hypothetical protein